MRSLFALLPMPLPAALLCLVVAISDGDTLTARCGTPGAYERIKVRVAAIDAPERRQAFGQKARQHLAQLCFKQQATLQRIEEDSYGRTVANVRCNGADVASAQVAAGLAWVYTPYAEHHPHLAPLQRRARAQGDGLWAQKRPLAPWDYRHRHPRPYGPMAAPEPGGTARAGAQGMFNPRPASGTGQRPAGPVQSR